LRLDEELESLELRFARELKTGRQVAPGKFVLSNLGIAREAEERLRTVSFLYDAVTASREVASAGPLDPPEELPPPSLEPKLPTSGEVEEAELEVFDRFRLIEEIGRGSFGTVFWAYDSRYDRDVALKVLVLD
jgi:hypothetical protein